VRIAAVSHQKALVLLLRWSDCFPGCHFLRLASGLTTGESSIINAKLIQILQG
jgi:hypothetical protein